MRLYSVTSVLCIVQVLLFIVELIVGGAKFDGAFVKENKMAGPSGTTLKFMGGSVSDTHTDTQARAHSAEAARRTRE